MKKAHLIGVLGVLTALITCPVLADSISDGTQAKVKLSNAKRDEQKLSDVKQDENQSKKSSGATLIVSDAKEESVDCFYSENATNPLCKK